MDDTNDGDDYASGNRPPDFGSEDCCGRKNLNLSGVGQTEDYIEHFEDRAPRIFLDLGWKDDADTDG